MWRTHAGGVGAAGCAAVRFCRHPPCQPHPPALSFIHQPPLALPPPPFPGDTATLDAGPAAGSEPYYRLLGRTSVDVLKRGGHKISALGVESALLAHPGVAEAAVLGLPDPDYGEVTPLLTMLSAPCRAALRFAALWLCDPHVARALCGASLPLGRPWRQSFLCRRAGSMAPPQTAPPQTAPPAALLPRRRGHKR
jgi:hypothetical protein